MPKLDSDQSVQKTVPIRKPLKIRVQGAATAKEVTTLPTVLIGKTKNRDVWPGTGKWVLNGRFLIGQQFWKPIAIALVLIFYNCVAVMHASVSLYSVNSASFLRS